MTKVHLKHILRIVCEFILYFFRNSGVYMPSNSDFDKFDSAFPLDDDFDTYDEDYDDDFDDYDEDQTLNDYDDDVDLFDDVFKEEEDYDEPYDDVEAEDGYDLRIHHDDDDDISFIDEM